MKSFAVENHQPNIARLSDKPVTIRKKKIKNSSELCAGIPKLECGKVKKYLLDNVARYWVFLGISHKNILIIFIYSFPVHFASGFGWLTD